MSYYKMAFETTKHDLEITKPQHDPLLSVSSVKKRHSRGQEKFEWLKEPQISLSFHQKEGIEGIWL